MSEIVCGYDGVFNINIGCAGDPRLPAAINVTPSKDAESTTRSKEHPQAVVLPDPTSCPPLIALFELLFMTTIYYVLMKDSDALLKAEKHRSVVIDIFPVK